jgi:hypothetical protein
MQRSGCRASGWLTAAMLAVLNTTAPALAEDFTVHMKNDEGKAATRYVSQRAVRNVSSYPVETDVIYRLDQGRIVRVDHQAKTYTEATPAAAGQLPPDQSTESSGALAAPTVTRVGRGQAILGYATEEYAVQSVVGQVQAWVTTALAYPPKYNEMVTASLPPPVKAIFLGGRVQGVPLKTITTLKFAGGRSTSEIATAIEKGPIPPSTFEPPAGYKKLEPQ